MDGSHASINEVAWFAFAIGCVFGGCAVNPMLVALIERLIRWRPRCR